MTPRSWFLALVLTAATPASSWAGVSTRGLRPETLSAAELSRLQASVRADGERYSRECLRFEAELARLLPSREDNHAFESRQRALETLEALERQPRQGLALRRLVELGRSGAVAETTGTRSPLGALALPSGCGAPALLSGIHRLAQYRQTSGLTEVENARLVRLTFDFVDRLPREIQPPSALVVGSAALITLAERNLIQHQDPVIRDLHRVREDAIALARKSLRDPQSAPVTWPLAERLQGLAERLRPRN